MTATSTDSWIGNFLAGNRYYVVEKLDEGGMGVLYVAHDRNLETKVVIKVPHSRMLEDRGFARRFTREIRSLVSLTHPHVVKILDVGEHDHSPFAVMQYLPGGNLRNFLPFQIHDATGHVIRAKFDWLMQVSKALDFIHAQGYIHRDVKPPNIIFDEHRNAFLSDFGVAKAVYETHTTNVSRSLTGAGLIVGTLGYMAPEALEGKDIDGRADQYSLGATVYEAIVGRCPFSGSTPLAFYKLQTGQPPPDAGHEVAGVPRAVCEAVRRAMAVQPEHRFGSCTEFAHAILSHTDYSIHGNRSTDRHSEVSEQVQDHFAACPSCAVTLRLTPEFQGVEVRCANCQHLLAIDSSFHPTLVEDRELVNERSRQHQQAPSPYSTTLTPSQQPGSGSKVGPAVRESTFQSRTTVRSTAPPRPRSKIVFPPLSFVMSLLVTAAVISVINWFVVITVTVWASAILGPLTATLGLSVLLNTLNRQRSTVLKIGMTHLIFGLLEIGFLAAILMIGGDPSDVKIGFGLCAFLHFAATGPLTIFVWLRDK